MAVREMNPGAGDSPDFDSSAICYDGDKKSWICPFPGCGKQFSLKGNLKRHYNTHKGLKPFACAECGKCFARKADREVHMRVHTGEKPYRCSIRECGQSFARISDLRSHERTHSGVKKFMCPVPGCKSRFLRRYDLKKHILSHEALSRNKSEPLGSSSIQEMSAKAYGMLQANHMAEGVMIGGMPFQHYHAMRGMHVPANFDCPPMGFNGKAPEEWKATRFGNPIAESQEDSGNMSIKYEGQGGHLPAERLPFQMVGNNSIGNNDAYDADYGSKASREVADAPSLEMVLATTSRRRSAPQWEETDWSLFDHQHGIGCGHSAVLHDDHVDFLLNDRVLDCRQARESNTARDCGECEPSAEPDSSFFDGEEKPSSQEEKVEEDFGHQHSANCGHIPVLHDGHVDFIVGDDLIHQLGCGHQETHGTLMPVDNDVLEFLDVLGLMKPNSTLAG